ncbi:MAG: trigger factor, partial [Paludibacteraceae bacterium]|nr:trigger factor [Paludibacteraceae bacterium]
KMQFMQYGLMNVEDEHLTNYANEMLKQENQLRGIVERVVEDKIFAALKGVAKIEPKTVSQEEFDKLFK